jgi:hypothetical protein
MIAPSRQFQALYTDIMECCIYHSVYRLLEIVGWMKMGKKTIFDRCIPTIAQYTGNIWVVWFVTFTAQIWAFLQL